MMGRNGFRLVAGVMVLPLLVTLATGCRREVWEREGAPSPAATGTSSPSPSQAAQGDEADRAKAAGEVLAMLDALEAGLREEKADLDVDAIAKDPSRTADLDPLADEVADLERAFEQPSTSVDFGS